jgi:hypothetical protein
MMEDGNNEADEDNFDIQAYHSRVIKEYEESLQRWLASNEKVGSIEDFEDRELDALLLKVCNTF